MANFKTWLRSALCCSAVAVAQQIAALDAAQPLPPIAPYKAAPRTETIPRPQSTTPTTKPEPILADEANEPEPPPQRPLSALSIDIRPVGESPANAAAKNHYLAAAEGIPVERGWDESFYFWQASNMAHQPLYFQQVYVERYGYTFGRLQPIASGVQFLGDVAELPVKMVIRHPRDCVWTLGYGRPGSSGVPCPRY